GNTGVSAELGHSAVLTCPKSKLNVSMVTWKIRPKTGRLCTLAYWVDKNKTERTNCTDSMDWRFRSIQDPSLEKQQVGMADEGNYTCEVVNMDGNFHWTYHLTMLVRPRITLYCDGHGNAVCEAAAGKPAAEISWVPESNSTPSTDSHGDGTVTVRSRFTAYTTSMKNSTCTVSHATLNETMSIVCFS
ncbi:MOR1B protein, partial [Penelope pileata]|nr:MOR1B protein [Penelope pileata]